MSSDHNKVAVIGGGISGLTTATLLQLHGYKTRIYTRARLTSSRVKSAKSPQFASLHAAASILAHSVASQKATYWTNVSQEYFRIFAFLARCGVREQAHFEIFEEPAKESPDYWDSLQNVRKLTTTEAASPYVPRRPGANSISGWTFDMFFCEAPEYIAFIHRLYTALGGEFVESTVGEDGQRLIDYLRLDYGLYINCTGDGAIDFVNDAVLQDCIDDRPCMPFYEPLRDSASGLHIRGHYLQVDIKKLYTNDRGKIFSYNYTPSAEVYRHGDGAPADVYCYPRSDSWILGGSRQPCGATIGSSEMFTNDARARGDTELFPGVGNRPVAVPRAIFELNDQLLEGLTLGRLSLRSLRADRPDAFLGGIGLRFQRSDGLEGVRLSCSRVRLKTEKYIIHNYGHGGSGFTLSWGCAFDLLKMLNSITGQGLRVSLKRNRNLCVHHEIVGMLLLELTQQLIDEHK